MKNNLTSHFDFFHNSYKVDCRKKLAFLHFTFFPDKKIQFSQFLFFNSKMDFSHILCATFFLVKKGFVFMILKLSTIKHAFIEKVQF